MNKAFRTNIGTKVKNVSLKLKLSHTVSVCVKTQFDSCDHVHAHGTGNINKSVKSTNVEMN